MSDTLELEDQDETLDLNDAHEDGPEDRGDVVAGEEAPDLDALKAVAAGAEEDEAPKDEPERSKFVPHARFNEVNEAKKAAEQRAAELAAELERLRQAAPERSQEAKQDPKPAAFDFDAKEAQAAEALFAGDTETYRKVQAEIRAHLEEQATNRALEQFEQRSAVKTAQALLESTADRIASKYPILNSESDQANDQAIKDVVEWRDFYIAKGDKPHVALEKAANKVAPLYVRDEPEDDPEPVKVDPRKAAAVARAAAAAAAQPPAGGGVGERTASARLDIEKMSDEQFSRLSDEDKRRLRGD